MERPGVVVSFKKPSQRGNNRLNTEKFIERGRKVHGDRFDYSLVKYVDMKTKVIIVCEHHGPFEQSPCAHFNNRGCRFCKKDNLFLTQNEFRAQCYAAHSDRYDYSKSVYTHMRGDVVIICPDHGDFTQVAQAHVRGAGCKRCHVESMMIDTTEFIQRARMIHGDTYDYSTTEYARSRSPVTVTCRKHGPWTLTASSHIQGIGCNQCSNVSRGETRIGQLLREVGVHFVTQKTFPDLKGKGKSLLRYDFFVGNWLIEFHGDQHYSLKSYSGLVRKVSEEGFIALQKRDERKKAYAKDNGYQFLELSRKDLNRVQAIFEEVGILPKNKAVA